MSETFAEKTGGCLCGAVRFVARDVPAAVGICHCEQCRRWTGSALIAADADPAKIDWRGAHNIATYASSAIAERGFCRVCGSLLFWRSTRDPEATVDLMLGLFDEPNGFVVNREIFIDHKPDAYAFAGGDRRVLTRAQVLEKAPFLADVPAPSAERTPE